MAAAEPPFRAWPDRVGPALFVQLQAIDSSVNWSAARPGRRARSSRSTSRRSALPPAADRLGVAGRCCRPTRSSPSSPRRSARRRRCASRTTPSPRSLLGESFASETQVSGWVIGAQALPAYTTSSSRTPTDRRRGCRRRPCSGRP